MNLRLGGWAQNDGASFAVYAPMATSLELVLVGQRTVSMQRSGDFHSAYVHGVHAGQAYLYRNVDQLLLDPYARSVSERDGVYVGHVATELRVHHERPPRRAMQLIYEAHVRGMTMLDPEVPVPQRGTFRGLMHPHIVARLKRLGVTALELMPVFFVAHEPRLRANGLLNYWGYSPANFFAIEPRYAAHAEDPASELRELIRFLHAHDLQVILDVVYNHTGELDARTFSWRGLAPYYRTDALHNAAGCGNVLDFAEAHVRGLVLESLRYVHHDLGADGVRFDLGAIVLEYTEFAQQVRTELPELQLFAEPWDAMRYALGSLPNDVFEWNDRFRDDVRAFFRGDPGKRGDLASRYAGSSDILGKAGQSRSLNYVAAHDGFTLRDSVSYSVRHNHANGEDNRDGHAHEIAFSHGIEGPAAELIAVRRAHQRALLAVLYLSKGIPMLSHGDEFGRTQHGNNNAYCQDNEITWMLPHEADLFAWCAWMAQLRAAIGATLSFFAAHGEVTWADAEGATLKPDTWSNGDTLVACHETHAVVFTGLTATTVALARKYTRLLAHSEDARTDGAVFGALSMSARSVAVVATDAFANKLRPA
jgi:glycogen debranching enzyme GlgX